MSIGRTMPIRRMVLTMWRFRLRAMAGSLYKTSGVIDKPRRFARSSAGRLLQGEQNGPTVSLLRARGPRTLDLVLGRVGLVSSAGPDQDRKSTRLNSSHLVISYAVFCLK